MFEINELARFENAEDIEPLSSKLWRAVAVFVSLPHFCKEVASPAGVLRRPPLRPAEGFRSSIKGR